jgi:hypothetical protein
MPSTARQYLRSALPVVTDHRRLVLTAGVWLLAVVSVVSWRRGAIFEGGIDGVVVAKAVVAVIAAGAAFLLWRSTSDRRALSPVPALLIGAIVVVSLVGAVLAGHLVPNAVLAVRIALLAATALLVLAVTPVGVAVGCLLAAMATVGLVAGTTGAVALLTVPTARGRLGGGIPQLAPNELATLVLPAAIGLAYLLARRLRPLPAVALVALTGIIVWTGSRTALVMLVLGAVIAVLAVRRPRPRVLLIGGGVIAALLVVATVTGLLGRLLLRGEGIDRLLTLNSRLIAWQAVLATPKNSWAWWLGRGLTTKTTPVVGQYWKSQVFDSSWISSLAEDGVVGTVLLAVLVLGMLVAVAADRRLRPWALPLVVPLVVRSFVENGLIESSVSFVLLLVLATAAWAGTARDGTPDVAGRRRTVLPVPVRAR